MGFITIPVPEDEVLQTSILASAGWLEASKLVLIIQNSSGSQMGVFSRSICLEQGLHKGTMIPYIERFLASGYEVLILRANTNSILQLDPLDSSKRPLKIPIIGSESPEIHTLCVWENVVRKAENVRHVVLLGYGNGSSLCRELFLKEMANQAKVEYGDSNINNIRGFITIGASHVVEEDDAEDIKLALGDLAVNLECSTAPKGSILEFARPKLGCTSLSLGLPPGSTSVENGAVSVYMALDAVFDYLEMTERYESNISAEFANAFVSSNGLTSDTASVHINPEAHDEFDMGSAPVSPGSLTKSTSFSSKIFSGISSVFRRNSIVEVDPSVPVKVTVKDFELIKLVGKGSFGKVGKVFMYICIYLIDMLDIAYAFNKLILLIILYIENQNRKT